MSITVTHQHKDNEIKIKNRIRLLKKDLNFGGGPISSCIWEGYFLQCGAALAEEFRTTLVRNLPRSVYFSTQIINITAIILYYSSCYTGYTTV